MIIDNNFFFLLSISIFYILIYNLSLILIFSTFFQVLINEHKTLYSLINFKNNHFFTILLTIALFSMAGVPPFLGFFSKVFILIFLINSNFFIFYIFFFIILIFGLYFYIQNIRYLYSTNNKKINININYENNFSSFFVFAYVVLFFLIFGFFFIDDILLYIFWLLS